MLDFEQNWTWLFQIPRLWSSELLISTLHICCGQTWQIGCNTEISNYIVACLSLNWKDASLWFQ